MERVSGKKAVYERLDKTGWLDRDAMFELYNEFGMYGDKEIPDEHVLALGVELHGIEDFVRVIAAAPWAGCGRPLMLCLICRKQDCPGNFVYTVVPSSKFEEGGSAFQAKSTRVV